MIIKIREIKPQGLDIDTQIGPGLIEARDEDELEFLEPLVLRGKIERIDNEVFGKLDASSKYAATCSRCLEKTEQTWSKKLSISVEIEPKTEDIDLGDEIRQEVLLSLPPKTLCDKDCKGLCFTCGENLNEQQCKCSSGKK